MSVKYRQNQCEDDKYFSRTKTWDGNKEGITFIWLTRTDLNTTDSEGAIILKHLHQINHYIRTFHDPTSCIDYMKSIKNERIFLIIDGKLILDLYQTLITCSALDSIYIFCMCHHKYQHLQNQPKIAGIFTQQTSLFKALQNGIEDVEKQLLAFSRLDRQQSVLTKDLSQQSASFLWFMILVEVLEAMPTATEQERTIMLDLCASYYRDNSKFLSHISEFRETYEEEHALKWYTKSSFVYKLVNKALRVEDVELLYHFRFYIIDLCKQLKKRWLHAQSNGLTEITSTVHRGGKLTRAELDSLKPVHLITMNGFLSTTRNDDVARLFVSHLSANDCDYCGVIFHITIPENLTSLVFAEVDCSDTTFPDEKEVIFSIGCRFRVNRVYVDDENSYLHHIDLTATDDGREDINAYKVSIERDLDGLKAIFLFGQLLVDMGEDKKAKNYFQLLLQTTPINNYLDIATIHSYLGRIARLDGLFNEAFSHHQIALEIRERNLPTHHADLAASYNSLGLDYLYTNDYQSALLHFHRALDIETTSHGNDSNTNISKILGHIALTHGNHGNTDLALEYFHHALSIEQRLLPSEHIYIALRLSNIASCHMRRGDFRLSLQCYQQALAIVERILPYHHMHHVLILYGIMQSSDRLGDYNQAIEFAIRKLDSDTTLYKGWTMARLSELYVKINDLNKAYQYFEDATRFYTQHQSNTSSPIKSLKKKLKKLEQSFVNNKPFYYNWCFVV